MCAKSTLLVSRLSSSHLMLHELYDANLLFSTCISCVTIRPAHYEATNLTLDLRSPWGQC